MNKDLQAKMEEVRALDARLSQAHEGSPSVTVWGGLMVDALVKAQPLAMEMRRLVRESSGGEAGAELARMLDELRGLVSKWRGWAKRWVESGPDGKKPEFQWNGPRFRSYF